MLAANSRWIEASAGERGYSLWKTPECPHWRSSSCTGWDDRDRQKKKKKNQPQPHQRHSQGDCREGQEQTHGQPWRKERFFPTPRIDAAGSQRGVCWKQTWRTRLPLKEQSGQGEARLANLLFLVSVFQLTRSFYCFRKFAILAVLALTHFQGKEQSQGMLVSLLPSSDSVVPWAYFSA